jgi:hypothetical protein
VFLVNISRGSGSRRDPVRVVVHPSGRGGEVAIGDFQSETDEDHPAREREETKRLLYVALTRARDRLYLGSVLKEDRIQPARGSLAKCCRSLLDQLIERAGEVEWRPASGRIHRFGVCPRAAFQALPDVGDEGSRTFDSAPLGDSEPPPDRSPAVAAVVLPVSAGPSRAEPVDRLVGTLVHRL